MNGTSDVVVLLSDDAGVKHTGGRVQRIDSGVNSQIGDLTGKHGGSVQMGEGGGRGGIRQVIGGNVDGLNGGDRTPLGGANTLLQSIHIGGKRGLVAYGGRDAAKQGTYFGASLGESENVVDKQKHILAFSVTEVFGNSETSKSCQTLLFTIFKTQLIQRCL